MPKQLDPLPESSDKEFWGDAEIHTGIKLRSAEVGHNEFSRDGHYFKYIKAVTAECEHCHWGFQLDPGDYIKEGHLYNKQNDLVI